MFFVLMQYTSKFYFFRASAYCLIIRGALNLFMVVRPSKTQSSLRTLHILCGT